MGVTEILCSCRLVLEGKTGKEIPESSRLEFLEEFSANSVALSDAEDNTSFASNLSKFDVLLHKTYSKVADTKLLRLDKVRSIILLSKTAHQILCDHTFTQRNKATKRVG